MNKYVFFLDIDETLITDGKIPDENIYAVNEARRKGNFVFINTGRSPAFIPDWLIRSVEIDGFAASSGAYIKIGDKIVLSEHIPIETVIKNAQFIEKTGRQCLFEGSDKLVVMNPKDKTEFEIANGANDFLEKYKNLDVEIINLSGKISPAEKRYFSMFYNVLQEETYVECSIKNCDKGRAVDKIMEYYKGYTSVALGDSTNDIPMFAAADISIAMANSPDSIKHICTDETDYVENSGAAKAILKLIK